MDPHSIDSASAEATLGWDGPGDIATVEHETLDSAKSLFPSILSYYAWRDQIAELHERILLQDVASTRALLGRIIQLINDPLILSFDPSSAQRIELLSAASLCRASFGFLRQHYELPNCYDALKEELGGNPGAWKHRRKAKFDRISNSLSLTKRVLDIELSLTK